VVNESVSNTPLDHKTLERFDRFVYPDPNSGCFLWAGASKGSGHGTFRVGSQEDGSRRILLAHRYAWERANGPIPFGLHVCHKCDTPACVNPDHLFLGTHADNHRDKAVKGRGVKSKKGMPYGAQARSGRFAAHATVGGRFRYLGTFDTAEEASAVALAAKAKVYKEAANG